MGRLWARVTRIACLVLAAACLVSAFSCGEKERQSEGDPVVRFAVLADPHVYNLALGYSGAAFQDYMENDVKMLLESESILEAIVSSIRQETPKPSFVLLAGDMTKDGEMASHRLVSSYLAILQKEGIKVFVVPGNHDVSNPEARGYGNNGAFATESPDAEAFADIYRDFGYGSALFRDPDSLSYVAEPLPGIWLFSIDTCRYMDNQHSHVTGGRIGRSTLEWVLDLLGKAVSLGKIPIGLMHHGILEHLVGHGELFPEFILEDSEDVGYMLARAGMRIVFTGHYHTQNITGKRWSGETSIIEIQTGSTALHPFPYRVVSLDTREKKLNVESRFVLDVRPDSYPGEYSSFAEYALAFKERNTRNFIERQMDEHFNLEPNKAAEIADLAQRAMIAHQEGDEVPTWYDFLSALRLSESKDRDLSDIGLLLLSLWHDLPPGDNFFSSGAGFSF